MQSDRNPFDGLINYIEEGDQDKALRVVTARHLNLRNSDNDSVFHLAVSKKMMGLAKKLFLLGADPYLLNNKNESPLLLALQLNLRNLVDMILDSERQAMTTDALGKVLLFLVRHNEVEWMKRIGKTKNLSVIKDTLGIWKFGEKNTALHYAVLQNHLEMTQLLMAYGADPKLKNIHGESSIDWANNKEDKEILFILENKLEASAASSEINPSKKTIENIQSPNNVLLISDYQLYLKYKNVKDALSDSPAEFDAYLQALADRAVEIADDLIPKDIALIFNLIAKTNSKNKSFLMPMLEALSKRAQELAGMFKPGEIAMVYNLLSKLETVNSSKWQPLLEALSMRAQELAEKFKPIEIALVYNLLSKLETVNSSKWQPMLEALSKRAQAIAEKFKPGEIAMVYNLISKLESVNSGKWQSMLAAFQQCAKQQWDTFNRNLISSKTNISEPRGRMMNSSYIDFIQSMNHKIDINDLDKLGNVDKYNPANYFSLSSAVQQNAISFLTEFWVNEDNLQSTITLHREKCKLKFSGQEAQSLMPSCISFIDVIINGKKLCLISTSMQKNENLIKKVSQFTSAYNETQSIQFSVLRSDLKDFNEVICYLTGKKDRDNSCAEKIYAKMLAKLFLEFGDQVRVTGVVNCSFYPYQKNKQDDLAKPIILGSNTKSVKNFLIHFVPCCAQCMENKPAIFTLLSTAQRYGASLNNKNAERKTYLSPIRVSEFSPLIMHSLLGGGSRPPESKKDIEPAFELRY